MKRYVQSGLRCFLVASLLMDSRLATAVSLPAVIPLVSVDVAPLAVQALEFPAEFARRLLIPSKEAYAQRSHRIFFGRIPSLLAARFWQTVRRLTIPMDAFQTPEGLVLHMQDDRPSSGAPSPLSARLQLQAALPQMTIRYSRDFYDLMQQMEKANPARARQVWSGLYAWLYSLQYLQGNVWSSGKPLLGELSNFMELRRFRDLRIIFRIQRSPTGWTITFVYMVTKNQFGKGVQRWLDDAVHAADGRLLTPADDADKLMTLEGHLALAAPQRTVVIDHAPQIPDRLSRARHLREAADLLASKPGINIVGSQARPLILGALRRQAPDFQAIGIIYRHVESDTDRAQIRGDIEAWAARQPAGHDALIALESAYLDVQFQSAIDDPAGPHRFVSPLIENDIQGRTRALLFEPSDDVSSSDKVTASTEEPDLSDESVDESTPADEPGSGAEPSAPAISAPTTDESRVHAAMRELFVPSYRTPALGEDFYTQVRSITGMPDLPSDTINRIIDIFTVASLSHSEQQQRLQAILKLRHASSKIVSNLRTQLDDHIAIELEQPWTSALTRYAEDSATLRWMQEDEYGHSADMEEFRQALSFAILGAPAHRSAVVRGASMLGRELAQVVRSERFSRVILFDINESLILRALEHAGLTIDEIQDLQHRGRLELRAEPPLLAPEELALVMHTLQRIHTPYRSMDMLTYLYERLIARLDRHRRLNPLRIKNVGLLIQFNQGPYSWDAVPTLIERLLQMKDPTLMLPYRSGQMFWDNERGVEYHQARVRLLALLAFARVESWEGCVVPGGKYLISGNYAHLPLGAERTTIEAVSQKLHEIEPLIQGRARYLDPAVYKNPLRREYHFAYRISNVIRPNDTTIQRFNMAISLYRMSNEDGDLLATQIWAQEKPSLHKRLTRSVAPLIDLLRDHFILPGQSMIAGALVIAPARLFRAAGHWLKWADSWGDRHRGWIVIIPIVMVIMVLILEQIVIGTGRAILKYRAERARRGLNRGLYREIAWLPLFAQSYFIRHFGADVRAAVQTSEAAREALVPVIVNLLGSYDIDTRIAADELILDIGLAAAPALLDVLRDYLPVMDPEHYWYTCYPLLSDFRFPDPIPAKRRWSNGYQLDRGNRAYGAIGLLGELEYRAALPEVMAMFGLKGIGNATPGSVLVALGRIAEPASRFFLEQVLRAEDLGDLPSGAAEALAQFQDPFDFERILKTLTRPSEDGILDFLFTRQLDSSKVHLFRAVAAYGRMAIPALQDLLQSKIPAVARLEAGIVLSAIGDFAAAPALLQAIQRDLGSPQLVNAFRRLALRRMLQIAFETGRSLSDIGREIGLPSDSSFILHPRGPAPSGAGLSEAIVERLMAIPVSDRSWTDAYLEAARGADALAELLLVPTEWLEGYYIPALGWWSWEKEEKVALQRHYAQFAGLKAPGDVAALFQALEQDLASGLRFKTRKRSLLLVDLLGYGAYARLRFRRQLPSYLARLRTGA